MDEYPTVPASVEAADWPVLDVETVWENAFFAAGYDAVERPTGERAEYYWVEPADAVMVVALDGDDVVMVEQYRPRARRRTLELPAGGIDSGEVPETAARRELREETGYVADELAHVETYFPSGWVRYVRHVFVAEDPNPGEQALDDGEFVDVTRVPADEAIDRVRDQPGPTDGGALTPLSLARDAGYL
jgi:ADP-ribose pyrophosphatase